MKKLMAMLLALAMVLSLAACGGDTNSDPQGSTPGSSTPDAGNEGADNSESSYTDYSGGFADQVTIQIPVYDRAFEGWNVTDNYYTQWIQSEFGDPLNVKVEYVAIPRSGEVNAFMQMIAAHGAPDIIFHYDMPQAVNYWNEGSMQALDYDEFAYYAPTYWENMKDVMGAYGTVDGQSAFLFAARSANDYQWVDVIRQDWLDQVGMSAPTNWDEFMAVGKAFKEAGLGYYSYKVPTNMNYFYSDIGDSFTDEEKALYFDLNVAPFTWDATKEYLKRYNEAYNAGIIDPEFYLSKEDSEQMANFTAGRSATFGYYMSATHPVYATLEESQPGAKLTALDFNSRIPAGNTPYYYSNAPYGMIMGINNDTTDEERAAVYMLLEWMAQPDNLFKLEHGVEGETFNYNDDGIPVHIDAGEVTASSKLSNNNNKDYWCLVEEVVTYGSDEKNYLGNYNNWAAKGYEKLVEDNYTYDQARKPYAVVNPIFTQNVESQAECSQELKELWMQAATELIRCNPDEFDAKYDEWCQDYLDAGYQDILDEKAEYFESGDVLLMN